MIDPRSDAQRNADEARERSKRAVALLAKVDRELKARMFDIIWQQRRNANPWKPSMQPVALREPFE